ncbi:MAG: polymer-forming cytoskeletal protein [Lachnospiraceae bacterium]|nr:polymer-forming cytoskeletal protein [Lachnospiraceae bacterium]
MGFFSDLKDDLNQAVNEMMPEGELDAATAGDELSEDNETGLQQESVVTSEALSDMLDMVEAISTESGVEIPEEELTDAGMMEQEMELPDAEVPEQETELPEVEIPEQTMELPVDEVQETETYDMDMTVEPEISEQPIEEIATESILEPTADEEPLEENEGEENIMEDVMSIESKVVSDETAVVTEGMSITGDITSGGSLELIGNVIGNIEILGKLNITGGIQGNSKAAEIYAEGARINGEVISQGSVKIGQSSVVIGNITANSAVIAGAVKGDIDVHGPVILDTSAIVMGNIKSKSVQINNGAVIEGMCSQCYADVNPTSFFDEINKKSKKKEK